MISIVTALLVGLTSLAAWTDWMLTAGFTANDLLSGFEECKLAVSKEQRVRYSRGPNQQSITAASLFVRFLRLLLQRCHRCAHRRAGGQTIIDQDHDLVACVR